MDVGDNQVHIDYRQCHWDRWFYPNFLNQHEITSIVDSYKDDTQQDEIAYSETSTENISFCSFLGR